MLDAVRHAIRRRADLKQSIDLARTFEAWEESCVPSYCHGNWAAAAVSWLRLFYAVRLARAVSTPKTRALDFGSSVGELGHLLIAAGYGYDFVEQDEKAAAFLQSRLPTARRQTLESAPAGGYATIFAIDSLEHNDDFDGLLQQLAGKLAPGGILILSGPTENILYRLGRKLAGFDGHYHHATIYDIEAAAARHFDFVQVRRVLPLMTLFRITAWRRR